MEKLSPRELVQAFQSASWGSSQCLTPHRNWHSISKSERTLCIPQVTHRMIQNTCHGPGLDIVCHARKTAAKSSVFHCRLLSSNISFTARWQSNFQAFCIINLRQGAVTRTYIWSLAPQKYIINLKNKVKPVWCVCERLACGRARACVHAHIHNQVPGCLTRAPPPLRMYRQWTVAGGRGSRGSTSPWGSTGSSGCPEEGETFVFQWCSPC